MRAIINKTVSAPERKGNACDKPNSPFLYTATYKTKGSAPVRKSIKSQMIRIGNGKLSSEKKQGAATNAKRQPSARQII